MVRFKNRYLLLSLTTRTGAPPLTASTLTKLLRHSLSQNFGDLASGHLGSSLTCKYYSAHTGTAIVRCAREGTKLVWAACSLIGSTAVGDDRVGATQLRIDVVHCGGTVRKVQRRAVELDTRLVQRLKMRQKAERLERSEDRGEEHWQAVLESGRKQVMALS